MKEIRPLLSTRYTHARCASSFLFVAMLGSALAQSTTVPSAGALLEKHASLKNQLANNAYGRPLYLDSSESGNQINGNAYAVLDTPFNEVSATFKKPASWCEVMILHINTKYCRAELASAPTTLKVNVGKKTPQTLQDSFAIIFAMRQPAASAQLMSVQLHSENGPMGTSNYRIELEAAPLPDGKTFMHLRYGYESGVAARVAMQGYLATAGRSKVGFTRVSQSGTDGKASYVGGARGAVERNTMRYFLAIDAYFQSLVQPPASQVNTRLEKWFDATEQYPTQLRETDKVSYMAMKKNEIQRQQTGPASP